MGGGIATNKPPATSTTTGTGPIGGPKPIGPKPSGANRDPVTGRAFSEVFAPPAEEVDSGGAGGDGLDPVSDSHPRGLTRSNASVSEVAADARSARVLVVGDTTTVWMPLEVSGVAVANRVRVEFRDDGACAVVAVVQ